MKIASFNINGIKARLETVLRWLHNSKPDVAVLQEIKSSDENFPASHFEDLGYNLVTNGQKSFNGVAILSKYPIDSIRMKLEESDWDLQARWLDCEIKNFRICGLYLPNGNPLPGPKFDYKVEWMKKFYQRSKRLVSQQQPTVILGDFNIIPTEDDMEYPELWKKDALYDLKCRELYRKILYLGYTDAFRCVNDKTSEYTFWDYQGGSWQKNNGIRIDHILLSPQAADLLENCEIDTFMRAERKPSDHVPIWVELSD